MHAKPISGAKPGEEEPARDCRGQWEGFVVTQEFYEAAGKNTEFLPVDIFFAGRQFIPMNCADHPLRPQQLDDYDKPVPTGHRHQPAADCDRPGARKLVAKVKNRAESAVRPSPFRPSGGIFISYASEDRASAESLAGALTQRGWSVWWDRSIPPGKVFADVIEAALADAKCVIVLWSKNSVTSGWVKAEAADALERQILIPALIEEVRIPLEFRRLQAARLLDWSGSTSHSGFESLVGSIAGILGKP